MMEKLRDKDSRRLNTIEISIFRKQVLSFHTSFLVPVNLATKLSNAGYDVNFFLPWNRPHSGDYNLNDLFEWLDSLQ